MKEPAVLTFLVSRSKELRWLKKFISCVILSTVPVVTRAQSVGGTTSGAAAYCDSINSGFISLQGYTGQILHWEQSTDNQQSWQQIPNNTSTQSYNQLKQTTSFRAVVQDGSFPPDFSTVSTITVHIPGVAGNIAGGARYCASGNSGTLILQGTQGNVLNWQSKKGSGNWESINNTTYNLVFTNLVITTSYRAVVERVPGCNPDTSSVAVIEIDDTSVAGTAGISDTLCYNSPGDTLFLTGSRGDILQWITSDDGKTWNEAQQGGSYYVYGNVTQTLRYAVIVKSGVCKADTTIPVIIASFPKVIAEAGPDVKIKRYESVQLNAKANGEIKWHPTNGLSDSTSLSPVASPIESTVYHLSVKTKDGCTATDSILVFVEIPIPSAITPNGDGVNDTFEIFRIENFQKNTLRIYDRWGTLIYQASPYRNEWNAIASDGSLLPEDTYYYMFDYGTGAKPVSGYIYVKR